ncbi:MAG: hypothetical protein [Bacteriophage sp.]|nr:MAG: hypothetical protein [Bacteriophage sp.]
MFSQSRDTTINKGVNDTQVINELTEHFIKVRNGGESQLITIQSDKHDDWFVYGLGDGPHVSVKPFTSPVKFDYDDFTLIIIDMRTSTRWDRQLSKPVLRDAALYRRDATRVLFEQGWLGDGPQEILNLGSYQVQTFCTWIAEMFARRFALDADQQARIQVISGFYYLCLFSEPQRFDPQRTVPILAKVTRLGVPYILETLNGIEYIGNLEELLTTILDRLQTDRLNGLSVDVMVTMLGGSWFGPNAAMLVGIALEYPPMWNTFLYLGLTDRSTKISGIAKLALRKEHDPATKEYIRLAASYLIQNSDITPKDIQGGLR